MNFKERLSGDKTLILDGAMGSLLMQRLPGYSGSFELLNADNPEVISQVHALYVDAGADIIETNTFGGSTLKLAEYDLAARCREINRKGAEAARKAAGERALVAGSVGPTGVLIEPVGDGTFDQVYEAYREQMIGLEEGGADLIAIETMNDIQEARIALLAAKENTKLPVIANVTLQESGKTHTGTDIVTAFATLAHSGADAVGANCGLGPEIMLDIFSKNITQLKKLQTPLAVWANAGLPLVVNGKTTYPMNPDDFAARSIRLAELGIKIIGGCCGTTPEHIAQLARTLKTKTSEAAPTKRYYRFATSRYGALDTEETEFVAVGERLNPTARKAFREELKAGKTDFLRTESRAQQEEGAHILDINVGVPGIDETAAMKNSVMILSSSVKPPLMIDSENGEVLENALKAYPGIPVVNSINGKHKKYDEIIPIIKRFPCFIVALCLDESGVHRDAARRIAIGDKLVADLEKDGISKERIIIDPLMLAESAEPGSAVETLKVIEHFANRGIKTSLGISNISFGLPERKHINNAFLKEGFKRGLSFGIVNTKSYAIREDGSTEEALAKDFIFGKDVNAAAYIEHFKGSISAPASVQNTESLSILETIRNLVVEGNSDSIEDSVTEALKAHAPEEIMDGGLIAGLDIVGERYEKGDYFLPQMISSANAMKRGFAKLKPLMKQGGDKKQAVVVICTVKGDIHDIGKNIVAMMMENHGFEVHDMGKDIENEDILAKASEVNADIICLSSLLTTTMTEMKAMAELIRSRNLAYKLMIGGAVVTPEYAAEIGAHYSKDAVEAANMAKKLIN